MHCFQLILAKAVPWSFTIEYLNWCIIHHISLGTAFSRTFNWERATLISTVTRGKYYCGACNQQGSINIDGKICKCEDPRPCTLFHFRLYTMHRINKRMLLLVRSAISCWRLLYILFMVKLKKRTKNTIETFVGPHKLFKRLIKKS